jgi:hypothetical protein
MNGVRSIEGSGSFEGGGPPRTGGGAQLRDGAAIVRLVNFLNNGAES